jgi:isopenicillin N synthase-like dioxygenase
LAAPNAREEGHDTMIIYTPPKAAEDIPVIDLAGSFSDASEAHRQIAWEIHKACRETGFFYVANHRVSDALIARQFDWARRFFDLPLERKMAIHMTKSPTMVGYEPLGVQVTDSQDEKAKASPPDLKEAFFIGTEIGPDHPYAGKAIRGYGSNQWPDGMPGLREDVLAYHAAISDLSMRVVRLIALSLDLPRDYFDPMFDMPNTTLRLLKYPPQPANAAFNQMGAGAHTDWGGVTLLAQDGIGGLEVRNAAGDWIRAKPIAGTFVVNLGDLIKRWTNGLYSSNLHRVMNNQSGRDRYSIPFFFGPRPSSVIEALPTCVGEDRPALFPPCTAQEHVNEMFRRAYAALKPELANA